MLVVDDNRDAAVTLQMTTNDLVGPSGGQTDSDSVAITLLRHPAATGDTYTVTAGTVLTVPAATGVLANDTDADTPKASLQAPAVTMPTTPLRRIDSLISETPATRSAAQIL